jgi:hypothetical protein
MNEATVVRHKGNAQHTGTGLEKLDEWLGDTKWDVIHFNWGLWDLCYRNPESKEQGNRDKLNGTVTTSPEQYGKNIEELVTRLQKTGATLIWANTTVVPENEPGRMTGGDLTYNAVAATIMKKHGVIVNDLNTLTRGFSPDLFIESGNVHYTKEGYQKIAAQVADCIRTALDNKQPNGPVSVGH